MNIEEHHIDVAGVYTRYLTAGSGPPLIFLHGAGESAIDWQWVIPTFTPNGRVYALDLPSTAGMNPEHADYSPDFFAHFVDAFLTAVDIERAVVVGHSLGGLVALYLALATPRRVAALGLVDSAGLGRAIRLAMRIAILPGYGKLAVLWGKTHLGALQRIWLRSLLLFAHPQRTPKEWRDEQYRLARQPDFLSTTLGALRAQIDLEGQRNVLLDQLSQLKMPTLVVWGDRDQIVPIAQAHDAIRRLPDGQLEIIPDCGHMPHVEQPMHFADPLQRFILERAWS